MEAGEEREAEYHQASLFEFMDVGTSGSVLTQLEREAREKTGKEYTYLKPKVETEIPHDYIVETLLHGSGYQNGKKRIYEMYQNISDEKERAKAIKNEYGLGGAGWPLEGYGLHGYDSFKPKGLHLQWRDEEGEKEGYVSWRQVEAEIGVLIMLGEYYQPVEEKTVVEEQTLEEDIEIEVTVNYEVPEENRIVHRFENGKLVEVSGDEREKEPEEDFAEEIIEEPTSAEERLSEFAIPDEMEVMGTPDYLKAEDAVITYAEYADEVDKDNRDMEEIEAQNYHLPLYQSETGFGAKTRFSQNMEAIRLLKQIESENRTATPEEQEVLAKYIGWGGLAQAFDERQESWSTEYQQLKELLTPVEYEAARASVNNAFYTPSVVASSITDALTQFGFKQGNILEPSMGIGNFFGCMPASLEGSRLYGVEIDSISARIGTLLYPKAKIENKGFEETSYPDNFFDAVIGNVPFGDYRVYDPKYAKLNFKIHDYFIAKAIDQVRPGGMVAVITTKGTLDKQNSSVRKYFAERAELVGAIRLPSQTFKDNAGTEVTSDILFFQKRERKESIEPDWVHLGFTKDGIPVNQYFVEHPEMMLGTMVYDKERFGDASNYTVCVNEDENFNLYEALQNAIRSIHAQMKDFDLITDDEEKSEEDIPADPDVKNYTYTFVDGKLYYRKDSRMFLKKTGDKLMDRIKGMNQIRGCVREVIEVQLNGCTDEELKAAQKKLNESYDAYVKKNGFITGKANASAFREDADYPLLCSLEVVDEDGKVSKADIFTKQTIRARKEIDHVETAVEALNISVNEFNSVNLPYMLTIYTPDISSALEELREKTGEEATLSEASAKELQREKLIEELKGVIFLNPEDSYKNL